MAPKLMIIGGQRWFRRLLIFSFSISLLFLLHRLASSYSSASFNYFKAVQKKSDLPPDVDPIVQAMLLKKNLELKKRRLHILEHVLITNKWPSPTNFHTSSVFQSSPSPNIPSESNLKPIQIPVQQNYFFVYKNFIHDIPDIDEVDLFLKHPARSSNRFCKPIASELKLFRYDYLLTKKFMLVLNLFNSQDILPDLLTALLIFISKLNPSLLHLSIYENGSKDETKLSLQAFRAYLRGLSVNYTFALDEETRPPHFHRIAYLAEVRNKAMAPLWTSAQQLHQMYSTTRVHFYDERFDPFTGSKIVNDSGLPPKVDKVIFLNDIMFCPEELLELVHQSFLQSADISCGMDYTFSPQPIFYDFWVARDKFGDKWNNKPFDKILKDGDPDQEKVNMQLPFQTYCCWNGGVVLNPLPFIRDNVRFRRGNVYPGECSGSECSVMCRDFLKYGYNRTIAVPKFKVAYEHPTFESIKSSKSNYVNRFKTFLSISPADDQLISFVPAPNKALCLPLYKNDSLSPEGPAFWEDLRNLKDKTPGSAPSIQIPGPLP